MEQKTVDIRLDREKFVEKMNEKLSKKHHGVLYICGTNDTVLYTLIVNRFELGEADTIIVKLDMSDDFSITVGSLNLSSFNTVIDNEITSNSLEVLEIFMQEKE